MSTHPWNCPLLTVHRQVVITERQADILAGICHGHTSAQIGARLFLSEHSVKTTTKRLLTSIGAVNRTHAAALVCSGQVRVLVSDNYKRSAA